MSGITGMNQTKFTIKYQLFIKPFLISSIRFEYEINLQLQSRRQVGVAVNIIWWNGKRACRQARCYAFLELDKI